MGVPLSDLENLREGKIAKIGGVELSCRPAEVHGRGVERDRAVVADCLHLPGADNFGKHASCECSLDQPGVGTWGTERLG